MAELEEEALERARADGLTETRAAFCSCHWAYTPSYAQQEAKHPAA
jgi:hypothetical protein